MTEIGVVVGSLSIVPGKASLDWLSSSFSGSLNPSPQLDHCLPTEDGSPPLCSFGLEGSRRFFGPAGRLNYISIHQPLTHAALQLPSRSSVIQ